MRRAAFRAGGGQTGGAAACAYVSGVAPAPAESWGGAVWREPPRQTWEWIGSGGVVTGGFALVATVKMPSDAEILWFLSA
jgi:hypothetical protein